MGLFNNWFKSREDKLLDQIFNLKFTAKQLARTAAKCEKEEKQLKAKVRSRQSRVPRARFQFQPGAKKTRVPSRRPLNNTLTPPLTPSAQVKTAIQKGNIEGAKIHATDSIRKKNENLNMLRLASRLDGVVSRLETQHKMNTVNKNMSTIVKSLEASLKDNNLEKVSENMDTFERQFENLDVQTEFVEQAMGNTTAATTPPEDVARLMQEVADENGLEFASSMPEANQEALPEAPVAQKEGDELSNRLAALRAR